MDERTLARFLDKVYPEPNSGCWLWGGWSDRDGYGRLRVGKSKASAHRLAFVHWAGPVPAGMFVCHRCDNPACVNPDHLFLGTAADNSADMVRKGRQASGLRTRPERRARGERHGRAKLTAEDVRELRRLYATGLYSQRGLAARFSISRPAMMAIVRREHWRHVTC